MNSQPFLSAHKEKKFLTAPDLIKLIDEGKTLAEITLQTGLSAYMLSKLLGQYQIYYWSLNDKKSEQRKYQKVFYKCYELAVSLNRLPHISETMHINGIGDNRTAVIEQLKKYGFHHSGKANIPLPPPPPNLDQQQAEHKNSLAIIDRKDMLQQLNQIYKDLGGKLNTHEIISKVSQKNIQPDFDSEPHFSGPIKLRNDRKQLKQKVRRQLLLLKLKSICAELGFSPDNKQFLKIDESFWHSLYIEFGGLNYALKEAGLEYRQNKILKKEKHEKLLLRLKSISEDLGFSPGKEELRRIDKTFYLKVYRAFGGLQNALKAAGLPVTRKYRYNNAISEL